MDAKLEHKSAYSSENDAKIELLQDVSALKNQIEAGDLVFPNRLAIQPMESADADENGAPTALTRERYLEYAAGCAGLIWFESCSLDFPEARSHRSMLVISKRNLPKIKKIVRDVKKESYESLRKIGFDGKTVLVLQLSHAGRYKVIKSDRSPAMAYFFPELDRAFGITEKMGRIIDDSELDALKDEFVKASFLAYEAGFDAIDVKACHGYLLNDLLSSFTREGKYGGMSFKKRTKFYLETIKAIRDTVPIAVTSRLNVFDGFPPPYGFGSLRLSYPKYAPYSILPGFDPSEPTKLLRSLKKLGVDFVNITLGNPYYSQYLTRPFDVKMPGNRDSPEPPSRGVARHIDTVRILKKNVPDMVFVGSGYSWLRQHGINAAAYNIDNGWTDLAGWGRLALSFPRFPKTTILTSQVPVSKVCVACSGCSRLLRAGLQTGCVIQNANKYKESLKIASKMGM